MGGLPQGGAADAQLGRQIDLAGELVAGTPHTVVGDHFIQGIRRLLGETSLFQRAHSSRGFAFIIRDRAGERKEKEKKPRESDGKSEKSGPQKAVRLEKQGEIKAA